MPISTETIAISAGLPGTPATASTPRASKSVGRYTKEATAASPAEIAAEM